MGDDEVTIGGDVILAIDDQVIREMDDLIAHLVTETRPGQVVTLTVVRDGAIQEIEVRLGERPR